jgi:fibronectin-binding autotransporter adhesin
MARRIFVSLLCCLVAALFVVPAFGSENNWNTNIAFGTVGSGPVTTNWGTSARWSNGLPSNNGNDINITSAFNQVTTITNAFSSGGGSLNFLRIISGNAISTANSNVTVVVTTNNFQTAFGFQIGTNATLVIANTGTQGSQQNNSFDLGNNAAKGKGTLAISNGATLFLAFNGGGIRNEGTVLFTSIANQTNQINYGLLGPTGGGGDFTNAVGGTIVKSGGAGAGLMVGNFSTFNAAVINNGTILVNNGLMIFDTRDAGNGGGFSNSSSGQIFISNTSTVRVLRTTGAFGNTTMGNVGTVTLNGGVYELGTTTGGASGLDVNRTNINSGTIWGNGTLAFSIRNDSGSLNATGGVLAVTGKIIGAGGTFLATNTGTLLFQGGNTGGSAGTLTGSITVSNSSAIIFSGGSDWQINSAASYGSAGLTAAQRGSLISSNSGVGSTLFLNNSSFQHNDGTLLVVGGNGINYGQIAPIPTVAVVMTNNFFMGGVGTFTGNFAVGASTNNNAILNLGTISTVAGGLLAIDTRNANSLGGLQNGIVAGSATGTIVIANGSTLSIRRTDAAWFGPNSPTNFGTITMQGGTLLASNTDFGAGSFDGGKFVNAAGGLISVTGTNNITNFRVIQNNGLITLAANAHLTNTLNSSGTFDNSGGGIVLRGTGSIQGGGANIFTVNGNYISTSTSFITNTVAAGGGGGGGAVLSFTGVTAVTNNGTIAFISGVGGSGGSGAGGNTNAMIAVGASGANVFRNSGTLIFGTASNAASRAFVISNQFVNTGSFIVSNGATAGAGGQPLVTIQGLTRASGGAFTNTSTGTIRLVDQATLGAGTANPGTITVLNGDFINAGTLTYNNVSNTAGVWIMSEANSVFSNAAGGRIIMESAILGGGDLSIRADNSVNAGTLVLSNVAGASGIAAMTFATTASGAAATNLTSSGTILTAGGQLNTKLISNTGTIFGFGTITGTIFNNGTVESSGGQLFMSGITNTAGIFADAASTMRVSTVQNTVSGTLTSTTAQVTFAGGVTNSGILFFQTSSFGTFSAAVLNNAGGVIRANSSQLVSTSTNSVFTSQGTVEFINSVGTFSGDVLNGGTWILDPSTNNFGGNLTITGTRNLTNSVDIVGTNVVVDTTGVYSLAVTSSVTVGATLTNAGLVFLQDSLVSAATLTNAPTGTIKGAGSISGALFNAGVVEATNGELRLNSAVNGAGTYRAVAGASASTLTFVTGGSISTLFNTSATVRVEGLLTNDNIFVNGGTVTVVGGRYVNTGNFTNAAGTVAKFINGVGTFSANVFNDGTWIIAPGTNNIAGNLTVATTGTRTLTSSVDIVGANLSVQSGGNYTLLQTSSVSVAGLYTNAGSTTLRQRSVGTFTGAAVNSGSYLSDASTNVFGSTVTNAAAGSMVFSNDSVATVAGAVANSGSLVFNASVGTFTALAANLSGGSVQALSSRLVFSAAGTSYTNAGTTAYTGSVGTFSGSAFNGGVWTLDSASTNNIAGKLTVTGTRNLTNSVDIVGGDLSVQAGGKYALLTSSKVSVSGLFTNAGDTTLRSFSIGTFTGAALNSGGYFSDNSTSTFAGSLNNTAAGTMGFSNGSSVVVGGAFNNAGTFAEVNSLGTFNGIVVNSGTWMTDPTTNTYASAFTNTITGVITMSAGDVFVFTTNTVGPASVGSFVNISTNNVANNLLPGTFQFENTTLALTQNLYVAGHDFNAPNVVNGTNQLQLLDVVNIPGFTNNFALGTLEISDFTTVRVWDAFSSLPGSPGTNDGQMAAIYLQNLFMGANSMLIISSNVQVYFINSNSWGAANFFLENQNVLRDQTFDGIHQLAIIPEPAVLLLWLSGIATIYAARRRTKIMNAKRS